MSPEHSIPAPAPVRQGLATDLAAEWTSRAYAKAGIDASEWKAPLGFRRNRQILHQLYYYYQDLYFRSPGRFLWAGLARLTGGQVLYGMNHVVRIAKDPCALTVNIVDVAKAIFENMAWQHELFLHDPDALLTLCRQRNESVPHPYAGCWEKILTGGAANISEGNKMLLHNEQCHTIQPYYERIRQDPYSSRYFFFTRFVMRNIHPAHRRFILRHPFLDVTRFEHRWKWIEGPKGMWQTWAALPQEERDRLVGLSNEEVIRHSW